MNEAKYLLHIQTQTHTDLNILSLIITNIACGLHNTPYDLKFNVFIIGGSLKKILYGHDIENLLCLVFYTDIQKC